MSLYFSADLLPGAYEPNVATQMTSGKAIARALRGLFLIDTALSTELVTALLSTGDDSKLTDIHESVSNELNTQVETLSENVDEAMDTDQRQTLLGINQGQNLERLTSDVMNLDRLTSDVMNQKVSPNALAESQELISNWTTHWRVLRTR